MRLLADAGNSRLKLAIWSAGRLGPVTSLTPTQLSTWNPPQGVQDLLWLSSSPAQAQHLLDWWAGRGPQQRLGYELPLPDCGQYPGCGLDRVVAGLAALAAVGCGCVVIDAGTAVTLSAWLHEPAAPYGARFAGGLILPGAMACLQGLHAAAPHLPLVSPLSSEADPAQHSTTGAIAAALGLGHPAMVAACRHRLAARLGLTCTVLTGGGADDLRRALDDDSHSLHPIPHLTLAGLALLATSLRKDLPWTTTTST